jgi:PPOX class probable F420-dependent enzyme
MIDLDRESYLSLRTYRRDGTPVDTPVWFAMQGQRCHVFSAGDAGKVKRLRREPRAAVAACDVRGRLRGPWIEGRGRVLESDEDIRRAYEALHAKYGWMMRLTDWMSRLTGRYDRRALLEIELEPQRQ